MPLTAIELCRGVLPMTNCGDCGKPTCLSFAMAVVQERTPLADCPHLDPKTAADHQAALDEQHRDGRWLKRDLAQDALDWARKRAADIRIDELPARIGGRLDPAAGTPTLLLPYFQRRVRITADSIEAEDGQALDHWEKVFLYNHLAQGGRRAPTGEWRGFEQFPNTVSKISSIHDHVEAPLADRFAGRAPALKRAADGIGGASVPAEAPRADAVYRFEAFPRVPLLLTFYDADEGEGFAARFKLMYDPTIVEHLDIESIVFLSERLAILLAAQDDADHDRD